VSAGRWLLLCSLVLGGCSPPASPSVVRVGTIGSIDELPLFVIQAQGLDRTHGLHLELTGHAGGARILDAMAAGSLDFAWSVGTVPLLSAAERGLVPMRALAVATNALADPEHPGIGVVVSPAVNRWDDLRAQYIGVYLGNSLGGAALVARLNREGARDYRMLEVALPNLGLALAGGTVAAVAMPEPFVTQSILRGDGKLLDWVIGGAPLPRMVYTAVVARSGFLREQRPVVKALLRAHLDAVRWINGNPGASRSIMARRLGISDELGHRIHLLNWPADARNDAALFLAMQGVLIEGGVLKAAIPADRVYDPAVLDDVLRERTR
jgi:ABC-type nitrate/sulfonate/bicarbonate transport system substrate-binding protein